ncbi:hypothetical protein [Chryseobacterium daecheongense]|uniref:Lipoprotein n=1 Tax=Chryseobacterium daecheongense TaxID=192389 RepID=A0A3N0W5K8_9FLAO|nr:hypothetical protein [Chryseobacterium daecheongense]ROI00342.1 hypothetical protein EGI05_05505 [Chryseobacterium daecheongense]TDX94694.1 hypothetical protein BCF50_0464 [Chryseobacterium daecheongense]
MIHKAIILSLGMLALASCNAQKETKTSTKTPVVETKTMSKEGSVIYFNEGENKFLKEYDMNVTFKKVSEDSRCPKGVHCIWAGAAVAEVEVMGTATRPVTLRLATMDDAGKNLFSSAEFNDYTISLAEITPYPNAEGGAKALNGKYKIGIRIKETGPKPTIR